MPDEIVIKVPRVEDFDRLFRRDDDDCECHKKQKQPAKPCGGQPQVGPAEQAAPRQVQPDDPAFVLAARHAAYWQKTYEALKRRGFALPPSPMPLAPDAMANAIGAWLDGRPTGQPGVPPPKAAPPGAATFTANKA